MYQLELFQDQNNKYKIYKIKLNNLTIQIKDFNHYNNQYNKYKVNQIKKLNN